MELIKSTTNTLLRRLQFGNLFWRAVLALRARLAGVRGARGPPVQTDRAADHDAARPRSDLGWILWGNGHDFHEVAHQALSRRTTAEPDSRGNLFRIMLLGLDGNMSASIEPRQEKTQIILGNVFICRLATS